MLFSSAVRQRPPTRMSSSWSPTVAPSGPHHFKMMSGLVKASNSFSGGAAITRETVRTRSSLTASFIVIPFFHQPLQAVERGVPELAVTLQPILDLAEAAGARAKHAELPVDPTLDDAGVLQDFQVARD